MVSTPDPSSPALRSSAKVLFAYPVAKWSSKVSDELIVDIEHYRRHPCCDRLWCAVYDLDLLTCISHHTTVEARDTTARTSLRLLAVLNVLFKYACARQAARASS